MGGSSELVRSGRVWKFGDGINTDLILPHAALRLPRAEQHRLCFDAIRPGWAGAVRAGDLIVAGRDFGLGSGRPVGAVLRACGIAGLAADSVNGLCLRNCINSGLPVIECAGVSALFEEGDRARIDFVAGRVENLTRGGALEGRALDPFLAEIVAAGGVIPLLVRDGFVEAEPFVPPA